MSAMTISFNVGTSTSLAHNNRDNVYGNPDIDVSKTKDNIYYRQENIEEVYELIFNEAVSDYNAKQKRNDRKIDNYYSKILHDKKTEHQREIIVAIGTSKDLIDKKLKKKLLDDYMNGFQDRNPNLKVYNAVLHLDEANPHLHINYVPHFTSSRGLSKRVGQNKALEQQGFADFKAWRDSETGVLESQMKEYKLKREFKGSHAYLHHTEYKQMKDVVNTLESTKNTLKNEIREEEQLKYTVQSEIKVLESHLETIKDFDNQHTPKVVLGRVTEQEYKHLKDSATKQLVQSGHLKEENKKLTQTIEKYARDNTDLEREVLDLKKEKKKINIYKDELSHELEVYKFFIRAMGLEKALESSKKLIKSVLNLVKAPYKFTLEQYKSIQKQIEKTFELQLDIDEDVLTQLKNSPTLENNSEWELDR